MPPPWLLLRAASRAAMLAASPQPSSGRKRGQLPTPQCLHAARGTPAASLASAAASAAAHICCRLPRPSFPSAAAGVLLVPLAPLSEARGCRRPPCGAAAPCAASCARAACTAAIQSSPPSKPPSSSPSCPPLPAPLLLCESESESESESEALEDPALLLLRREGRLGAGRGSSAPLLPSRSLLLQLPLPREGLTLGALAGLLLALLTVLCSTLAAARPPPATEAGGRRAVLLAKGGPAPGALAAGTWEAGTLLSGG